MVLDLDLDQHKFCLFTSLLFYNKNIIISVAVFGFTPIWLLLLLFTINDSSCMQVRLSP